MYICQLCVYVHTNPQNAAFVPTRDKSDAVTVVANKHPSTNILMPYLSIHNTPNHPHTNLPIYSFIHSLHPHPHIRQGTFAASVAVDVEMEVHTRVSVHWVYDCCHHARLIAYFWIVGLVGDA